MTRETVLRMLSIKEEVVALLVVSKREREIIIIIFIMPTVEGRVFLCLSPLVNIDLFKRGHYHISCRLSDSLQKGTVSPLEIKDIFGSPTQPTRARRGSIRSELGSLSEYTYPGATKLEDRFITQTCLIEYTDQSFVLGEHFLFKYVYPIRCDHTEVYVPSQLTLTLDLMFNGDEELPSDPSHFEKVATRVLSLTLDWRCGLHCHWPVIFDYFHMASVGVTAHASLYSISPDMPVLEEPVVGRRRSWFLNQASPRSTPPISYANLLFGGCTAPVLLGGGERSGGDPSSAYSVPAEQVRRARQVHQMIADVLTLARDSLRRDFETMSGQDDLSRATSSGPYEGGVTLDEVEEECKVHMVSLSLQLQATWEWFCNSALSHPDTVDHLLINAHKEKLKYIRKTFLWSDEEQEGKGQSLVDHASSQWITNMAAVTRKGLINLPPLYCIENVETSSNASIVFVEACPWLTRRGGVVDNDPKQRYAFQDQLSPYLLTALPGNRRQRRRMVAPPAHHLVVCVHGLQGNQFDLRLYRTYLELALPHQKIEFLMSQANQLDTFTDFNIMTDRLQEELLSKLIGMPHPPTHISFLAHSLGGIVVRSLVTRQAIAHLIPSFHFFLSICGPHLGTQYQTGMVSAGMWFVRKWYQSQSLLQLSLKDSSNLRDTFLYQLSEAQTFECFRHVMLLSSPQDKYVPFQSARLCTGGEGTTALDKVHEEMASRMMLSMEQFGVNLTRVTVHHALPTSAHSVIGRAAHIAMLDNELFVEKLVLCHIGRYFV